MFIIHLISVRTCFFVCAVCGCDMAQSGFFMRNGEYLCPLDFQRLHGTLCNNCREFVEGEVVTVLGKTYHPACFVCTICKYVQTPPVYSYVFDIIDGLEMQIPPKI